MGLSSSTVYDVTSGQEVFTSCGISICLLNWQVRFVILKLVDGIFPVEYLYFAASYREGIGGKALVPSQSFSNAFLCLFDVFVQLNNFRIFNIHSNAVYLPPHIITQPHLS